MKIVKQLLLCSIFISNIYGNDIGSILKNIIDVYGGEKNIEKLNSYKQVWKVFAVAQNINGTDNREVILPHTLKTTLSYPLKTETRVLTPLEKYRVFNGQKEDVSGVKEKAMMLQLKRLYSPLVLKQKAAQLKLEDYKTHYALVLDANDDKVVYFVDKNTYAITQVTGFIYVNNQTIVFKTLYTKFQKFDGVLVPTKEYKYTNEIQTAILNLETIDFIK